LQPEVSKRIFNAGEQNDVYVGADLEDRTTSENFAGLSVVNSWEANEKARTGHDWTLLREKSTFSGISAVWGRKPSM